MREPVKKSLQIRYIEKAFYDKIKSQEAFWYYKSVNARHQLHYNKNFVYLDFNLIKIL